MTKYLFLCHANVGRSQMAEAFAKDRGLEARSAGFKVENPGESIADYKSLVRCMEEAGYWKMGRHIRKQVEPYLTEWADKIIVMTEELPEEDIKDYKNKVIHFPIPDPRACSERVLCSIRDDIRKLVSRLEK